MMLKTGIRPFDSAARWGGEEFALAFLGMDRKQGWEVAEELRREIEKLRFEFINQKNHTAESFGKTISLGVAESKPGYSVENLFNDADAATYQSKNGGRNRTTMYEIS